MLYAGDKRVHTALLEAGRAERYRSIVGGLLWVSTCTRPDIAFTVSVLAQHVASPCEHHLLMATRVLLYLKAHPSGITYRHSQQQPQLIGYADASYASDVFDRRSTSGYVFMLAGAAVAWRAKKQSEVVNSTTEAEYIALFFAGRQAHMLAQLFNFIGLSQHGPVRIYEDNTAAKLIAEDVSSQQRTKHIDVKYHSIREMVARGEVEIVMVGTRGQHADICTKPLNSTLHAVHKAAVLGELAG